MDKTVSYNEYLYRMGMHDMLIFLVGEKEFGYRVHPHTGWVDFYNYYDDYNYYKDALNK